MALDVLTRRFAPPSHTDFPLAEFQQNMLLWVLWAGGLPMLLWQLFEKNRELILICLVTMGLGVWLMNKNRYLAGVVLFAGFSVIVFGLVEVNQSPLIGLALSGLPLILGVCFGTLAGGAAILALSGEVWWAAQQPGLEGLSGYVQPVILGGLVLLGIGLLVRYWMLSLVGMYADHYHRAARELNEAREQRVELKQVQEDLLHANNELARLTKQLKVLNQVAEEARMAKETFAAMVSHELRTPLNMIIGFSEVITQSPGVYGAKLPPTLLADITSIQRNSQHLLELVNDVLDLSQVDVGSLAISREWCSIQEIITEAFEVIQPLFQSKGLYLKRHLHELPAEADQQIYCDKTRVREIVINLLSNAGRFTESGGVTVRVGFENSRLVVAVSDTGPGISPENQAKLFEPFQQLDSSIRRRYGGSGLGLAISKRFVEMHSGKMWLESEVGRGTTFFFSLPINAAEDADSLPAANRWVNPYAVHEPRSRVFTVTLEAPKPRILLLEEEQTLQRLAARYLDQVEILPIAGIDNAAETAAQFPSQLLIINHPQSANLLNTIISQGLLPLGMPVLAFWMPGGKDFSDTIGANRYLVKPVSKEVLLDAIAEFGEPVRRILLVDDNPEIIQLFSRIIKSAGRDYQVLRASDGQQALELLRQHKPDLMILDLIMPEVTGFQVLEEKASDPTIRQIPVIVITAQDPAGLPKVSHSVTLAREGGFSARDLLEMVHSLGLKMDIGSR